MGRPLDIEALSRAIQNIFRPLEIAFAQMTEVMAQAFSSIDLLKEAFERMRVAEEERQRKAMMVRITRRVWRSIVEMIVFALLVVWWSR